jgi:tetratricopeptide (TPR) repeat protein
MLLYLERLSEAAGEHGDENLETKSWNRSGVRSPDSTADADVSRDTNFSWSIGRFQIKGRLGKGGFGIVWRAYDPRLERDVALKVLRLEGAFSAEARERFLLEAQSAARLEHPAIISPHEAGMAGKVPYVASPLCEGPNLAEWLESHPAGLSPREAAKLMATVADAVHHAHHRGILHRDLKPSNILLEPSAESASEFPFAPKLTDFGMAKRLGDDQGATMTGMVLGTSPYMSPEQAAGNWKEVGVGSDVFALGIILYEVLTGKRPFCGQNGEETRRLIVEGNCPSPRRIVPSLPRDMETICLKCMSHEIAERYTSAEAVAIDLGNYLQGLPLVGCPPGIVRRIELWCRRRPIVAGLLGIIAVIIILSLSAIGLALQRERVAQKQGVERREIARLAALRMLRYGQKLSRQPGLQREQRDFLEDALKVFDSLAQDMPQDEQSRDELQQALHYSGNIASLLGDVDPQTGEKKSLQYHRRSVEVLDSLVRDFPNNDYYEYSKFHNLLVAAGESGDKPLTGKEYIEEAESIIRKLIAEHPEKADYEEALTSLCDNLAMTHRSNKEETKATERWEEVRRISSRLVKDHPEKPLYAKNGIAALSSLGHQAAERGDWAQAIAFFEEGDAIVEKLKEGAAHAKADDRRWTEGRWLEVSELQLKINHANARLKRLKDAQATEGERTKIMGLLLDCQRVLETLVEWFPDAVDYRGHRANVNFRIGQLCEQQRDLDSAVAAYERVQKDREIVLNSSSSEGIREIFSGAEQRLKSLRREPQSP